mgnify:CR=1 FL=1
MSERLVECVHGPLDGEVVADVGTHKACVMLLPPLALEWIAAGIGERAVATETGYYRYAWWCPRGARGSADWVRIYLWQGYE